MTGRCWLDARTLGTRSILEACAQRTIGRHQCVEGIILSDRGWVEFLDRLGERRVTNQQAFPYPHVLIGNDWQIPVISVTCFLTLEESGEPVMEHLADGTRKAR